MAALIKDVFLKLITVCDNLDEEIRLSFKNVVDLVRQSTEDDNKLALEKAKVHHYQEIIKILNDVKTQIQLISYHHRKIEEFNNLEQLSLEDLKAYSYVQRQVKAFSMVDEPAVTKREKRAKTTSDISLKSLDMWEQFLSDHQQIEPVKVIPRRNKENSARKKKKFVSSTFNEFLDDNDYNEGEGMVKIEETPDDDFEEEEEGASFTVNGGNLYSVTNILKSMRNLNDDESVEFQENDESDIDKPKIVDILYKKKPSL